MATQLNVRTQLGGTTEFGSIQQRALDVTLSADESHDDVVAVKPSDINKVVSFAEFSAGTVAVILKVGDSDGVKIRFNSDVADQFTIPAGGMLIFVAAGINDIRFTGLANETNVMVLALGDNT